MLKRLFGARTAAPDSADACFRLGSELAQRGELDQAITLLRSEGRFLRGRLASGMLRHLGLDELVAPSDEAYVELAVTLAADRQRRQELRRRIESARQRLYRDAAPVEALQRFIESAVG